MERGADGEGEEGGEEGVPRQEASRDPQGSAHSTDSPAPQQVCHQVLLLLFLFFPPLAV